MEPHESQVESIFFAALERSSPEERAAYVADACEGDNNLHQRVERLLGAHPRIGDFLQSPATAFSPTVSDSPISEAPGDTIGPYRLLEQIGEGGFGVVFMAEQTTPVKRKVALKVIKPGMDTREVIARFEAERQALALMDHPNIARVFDAGATATGRPFFVMELVRGVPITDYCDHAQLTPRERLDLFVTVCQAVQHAHQKGIIHRDIKPTNVLVALHDDRLVVKVIDFGVAKATSGQLTDKTLFTGFAQVVGTPLYMSPEQAALSAIDIDTRSDIYSLGVLLYELLTGTTPFDKTRLQQAAFEEIRRIIREEEPQKPSTRLSSLGATLPSVSAVRRTEPHKLSRLLRGDLDWIVMKALEKDRSRRYETASGFAADLQRYLADEPVHACPPSLRYRVHKFARRHKSPVLAASLVFLTLVCGVIGTTWGLIRAEQHRVVVERQRDELAERNQALQAAHERERLLSERARQAIETVASDQAIDQFTRENELRPEQKDFLDKMIQYYAESAQAATATGQERSRQALAYHRMGRLNQILGRSQDSETAYRRAVAIRRQLAADFAAQPEFRLDLALSHNYLASVLRSAGRPNEAEAAYVESLAILKQLAAEFPARHEYRQTLAGVHNNLGNLFYETERLKEAEDAQAEALAIRKQLAADFPNGRNIRRALAMSHNNLGWLFQITDRLPEAEAAYRDAVALQRQQLAESSNQPELRLELAKYLFNLGNVLRDTGRPEDAQAARAEAVVIFQQLVVEYPNRPEFRQELTDRGLQEVRGVGGDREEELTSDALDASDFPNN